VVKKLKVFSLQMMNLHKPLPSKPSIRLQMYYKNHNNKRKSLHLKTLKRKMYSKMKEERRKLKTNSTLLTKMLRLSVLDYRPELKELQIDKLVEGKKISTKTLLEVRISINNIILYSCWSKTRRLRKT
jgi:hypothetical protein